MHVEDTMLLGLDPKPVHRRGSFLGSELDGAHGGNIIVLPQCGLVKVALAGASAQKAKSRANKKPGATSGARTEQEPKYVGL